MRAICMALVSLAMTGFLAAAELMVNLHFPKLDWDNDTVVIKQSASAMIACLGSILIVAAAAGLYVLTGRKIGFRGILSGDGCVVYGAGSAGVEEADAKRPLPV